MSRVRILVEVDLDNSFLKEESGRTLQEYMDDICICEDDGGSGFTVYNEEDVNSRNGFMFNAQIIKTYIKRN